ncbi:polysaccharide biosynthesis protein [Bacteroides pectinophilus CAG:437]|uniref:Polysaccharide biosynthesis protein n=1 Tax=Bacteroides pectinophilus CAG:437 TaxID=1263051 RepID=R7B283_9FIRM|nr:polysaccharide biosynthesis protein [Bacteroides pectinophilus CAG:437]
MGKKNIKEFIYNVIATALPTLMLQLVILPIVGTRMNGDEYGLLLTIVAGVMLVAAGLGNVLNNVRMLTDSEYKKKQIFGDFGVMLALGTAVVFIFTLAMSKHYNVVHASNYILNIILGLTLFLKEYYIVRFWIDLDYLGILKTNALCVAGYVAGMGLFMLGASWQLIYIVGNMVASIYIFKIYGVPKTIFNKTELFVSSVKKCVALTIATILSRALVYVDRLMLYPLMGGNDVSIYYVSTLIGKTITMAVTPINGYLLSKLAKKEDFNKKDFLKILSASVVIGVISYIACIIVARPVLEIMYPQYVNESMKYVYITTAASVISALSVVISPVVMRFCNMNWQIVINGMCFVVYVLSAYVLLEKYQLFGFCIGSVVANVTSLMLMILVFLFT